MGRLITAAAVMVLALAAAVAAQGPRFISAEDLKKRIDTGKRTVIVDARTEDEYRQGHIPKAINVPPEKVDVIGSFFPRNKKVPIVFYCRGPRCGLSKQAAAAAENEGYSNLFIYQGGYPEWVEKGYKTVRQKK